MNEKARQELGKIFIDFGKLLFAGIVLSSVLKIESFSSVVLITGGIIGTLILCALGIVIINQKNKK